jgi:hypothetical protein
MAQLSVTRLMPMIVMNLVAPEAGAKYELFNKLAFGTHLAFFI